MAIDAIVVPEEVPRLTSKRGRLPQLLNHQLHGRVWGNGEVQDLASGMIENQKDI